MTGERGRTSGMRGDSGLSGGKMFRREAPQHDRGAGQGVRRGDSGLSGGKMFRREAPQHDRGKGGASRHDRKGARGVRYAGGGYVWRPDRTSPPAPAAPTLRDIHRPLSLCRPTSAARPVILSEAKDLLGILPDVSGGKMLRREAPQHDGGEGQGVRHAGRFRPERREDASSRGSSA